MTDEKRYTEAGAQRFFAADFHGKTWELLEKTARTEDDNARMLDYAHASLAHWRFAGTAVHHQRGEWMLARVYAVLGEGALAIRHAERCLDLLEANRAEMEEFDPAFAYEALARAYAVSGDKPAALKYIALAATAGEAIVEQEEREIFFTEFNGGDWNGMK